MAMRQCLLRRESISRVSRTSRYWYLGKIRVRQREVAALSGAPGWVSYLVPLAATRSGKSARPDSSQPGCGSTNKVNRNPVAHMDKSKHMDKRNHMDKSNHMDKRNHMGSIPAHL